MIKKKIFIATAVFASICMLGGCATSKSSKKAAEATTEAAQQAKATPVKLNASEYVKLGQYKGLTIKGASTKVTDQDVEDQVNELAQDNASYEEIKDRKTVQKDDYLNVDYTTTINGKENSDYSDSNLDMHLGDGNLNVDENVDVDEKLIGAKVGDTVTIEFTFPEDYDDSSIAGKKCELAVSINMIEKEVIPEVNDALVKENTDCKTVKEYKEEVASVIKETKLPKTNIFSIDNLLEYMKQESEKDKIDFKLNLDFDINEILETKIPQSKLETMLADHIRDAIIAINCSENKERKIKVVLDKEDNNYQIKFYDTGIEFEIETLSKLGLKRATTHKATGGSGIGFMTTFETLKQCKASLIIEEYSDLEYTKAVIIKFDNKNEYRIHSYRAEEIKNKIKDNRIIIE